MKKIFKDWQISLLVVVIFIFSTMIYWRQLKGFAESLSFTILPNEEKCVHYYGIKTVASDSDIGWNAVLAACHALYANEGSTNFWRESYAQCVLNEFRRSDLDDIPEKFSRLVIQKCRYEIAKEKNMDNLVIRPITEEDLARVLRKYEDINRHSRISEVFPFE